MPLRSLAPRSSSSNRLPSSLRVLSAITTPFGFAMPCNRAARLGVLPTIACNWEAPDPIKSPTTTKSGGNADTRLQGRMGLQITYSSDQLQPCAHCPLCVVLVGLRIPEIHQHPITHVLCYEASEALHGLSDTLLIAADKRRRSSGSMRAERTVEPTKSENMTVTWRRSAVSCAFGSMLTAGSGVALVVPALRSDSGKYLPSWAKRNANVFQILIGKMGEYGNFHVATWALVLKVQIERASVAQLGPGQSRNAGWGLSCSGFERQHRLLAPSSQPAPS